MSSLVSRGAMDGFSRWNYFGLRSSMYRQAALCIDKRRWLRLWGCHRWKPSCKTCVMQSARSGAILAFSWLRSASPALASVIFSVVNALLIRPLPFRDPGNLVWIANDVAVGLSGQTVQVNHFLDLREQRRSLSDLAAYFAFYGFGDSKLTSRS